MRRNSEQLVKNLEEIEFNLEYPVTINKPLKLTDQEYSDDL